MRRSRSYANAGFPQGGNVKSDGKLSPNATRRISELAIKTVEDKLKHDILIWLATGVSTELISPDNLDEEYIHAVSVISAMLVVGRIIIVEKDHES